MKAFTLEEYLKDPERKVVTRDGRNAHIVDTDVKKRAYFPVLALVDEGSHEASIFYTKNGQYSFGEENSYDLFFASEKKEGWINIRKDTIRGYEAGIIYNNKEGAKKHCQHCRPNYIATVKVEWEE